MLRTEQEVDEMIADMVKRNKGKYITQAVAFNKDCPRQMGLLKKALMASISFSGLGKELLALKFEERQTQTIYSAPTTPKYVEKVTPIYQTTTQSLSESPKISNEQLKNKKLSGWV